MRVREGVWLCEVGLGEVAVGEWEAGGGGEGAVSGEGGGGDAVAAALTVLDGGEEG